MIRVVAPIVEGHGDVQAVPVLLRKLNPEVRIAPPVRFPKSKLMLEADLARAVKIARANIDAPEFGLLLLLLDADEDCPAIEGPRLLQTMRSAAWNVPCFVAFAKREFESWIIGGNSRFGDLDPDAIGAAKARIVQVNGGRYKETVDQAALTSHIDIARLEQCSASFRRLAVRFRPTGAPETLTG